MALAPCELQRARNHPRRFYLHPGGGEVAAPGPRVIARFAPGFGLIWEWDRSENRTYAPIPNYDEMGAVIKQAAPTPALQARLIVRTASASTAEQR